ncbi:MAG: Galactose-epimerase [Sediminibacterium sp.]|nr:Galactose-epimerase [Sediminibacterium sp.]
MAFEVRTDHAGEYPVITLKDVATGCEAEIYAFGGLLNAFRIPVGGVLMNVVEGFSSPADARQNITSGFKSAKLSPFVCRMYQGSYRLGKKNYRIDKFYLGGHAIHGLLYDSIYEVTHSHADDRQACIQLEHQYRGTDQGYPFAYTVNLDWQLTGDAEGNTLSVTTTVTLHHPESVPFADGWHPYFTLGGKLDEWTLQFDSDTKLEYDADLLPTGKTLHDERFLQGALLKDIVLDNSFVLKRTQHRAPGCQLSNDHVKLTIQPDASYPVLQVYIPSHRQSIAIENLSGAPDNFNNKMDLLMLEPERPQTFITRYRITAL